MAARRDLTGASRRSGDPHQLRAGIEDNLRTLGVAKLAAVNLRMMNPAEPPTQQLLRAVGQTEIVCVQNLFNLVDQGSAGVLAECAKRGIAFVRPRAAGQALPRARPQERPGRREPPAVRAKRF